MIGLLNFIDKIKGHNPRFEDYAKYVIQLKSSMGLKRNTQDRYQGLLERINAYIGASKIRSLRPQDLNELYIKLCAKGGNKRTGEKLSPKTVLEHHRLISSILEQAVRDGIVKTNVAHSAVKPKQRKSKVNYFQPETISKIIACLNLEPLKWQVVTHLLLMSGARRGEIAGLKWRDVDFERNTISFNTALYYLPEEGIFEDSLKTDESQRTISMPFETMELLGRYRIWCLEQKLAKRDIWQINDYVLIAWNGAPMHPDSITDWMAKFSKRHDLPHINPHAFRHTMASILYREGVDSVTISKRLGHANVSTTANIYAHVITGADKDAAECLSHAIKND